MHKIYSFGFYSIITWNTCVSKLDGIKKSFQLLSSKLWIFRKYLYINHNIYPTVENYTACISEKVQEFSAGTMSKQQKPTSTSDITSSAIGCLYE